MRYRSITKSFWNTGRNLFHNKFLYFMGGPRYSSTEEDFDDKNQLPRINFAVPNISALVDFKQSLFDIPKRMNTGCLSHVLDSVSRGSEESYMLCADAKKVTSGLDKHGGDVDMFGYENGETLCSRKDRLQQHLDEVDAVINVCQHDDAMEIKDELSLKLKHVIVILCNRMRECQDLKSRQEFGLRKFLSIGGTEWRDSKYVYAISSLQASLFQLKQQIENTHREVFILCREISTLQSPLNNFNEDKVVDYNHQRNMIRLIDCNSDSLPTETRFIKQRSPMWHSLRKTACVTGSSLHNALGLRGLREQKLHFEEFFKGKPRTVSIEVQKKFEHGTENEKHAIATIIGTVLPVYYPSACFVEEGCYIVESEMRDNPLIEVSPDGSIREIEYCTVTGEPLSLGRAIAAVEIKCPCPNEGEARPHTTLPEYYVAQCLAEMHVLNTEDLLFLSYTKKSTTAFNVSFDEELWGLIMAEIRQHYDTGVVQKIKKISENVPSLKKKISAFTKSNVRFLGEFHSNEMNEGEDMCIRSTKIPFLYASTNEDSSVPSVSVIDIRNGLDRSKVLINDMYNLLRQKATEVMVWVLSNKDRNSKHELPCSIPIAFGLKDYKLTSSAMRSATEYVLKECKKRNIRVDSFSADGQWIQLMNRDGDGRPSTIYQLQKDTWQDVRRMTKPEIVKKLMSVNLVESDKLYDRNDIVEIEKHVTTGALIVSCKTNAFSTVISSPKESSWTRHKKNQRKESQDKESEEHGMLDVGVSQSLIDIDWLPSELIQEISNNNSELLNAIRIVEHTRTLVRERSAADDLENNEQHESEHGDENPSSIDTMSTTGTLNEWIHSYDCLKDILVRLNHVSAKWSTANTAQVQDVLLSPETLTHSEIDAVYEYLSNIKPNILPMRKSWNKSKKISALKNILSGIQSSMLEQKPKRRLRSPLSMKTLSGKMLRCRNVPKEVIAIAYAQYIFPGEVEKWLHQSCIPTNMNIQGFETMIPFWFSVPEVSKHTHSVLAKGIDCSHNFTHLRVRTSTTGICGVSSDAWKQCAKSKETDLHPAIVEDLLDKQSVAFARTHFSEKVESWMMENNFHEAAILTRLIRKWYDASDSPSISAHDRVHDLLAFRNKLLDGIDFGEFPPVTKYFKGIPVVTFEGILMDIDSKLQLYGVCESYNIRSVGSLAAETTVGVLQTLNNTSQVSIKAVDVPRIMSKVVEVMSCKLNPNRGFFMRTSRRSGVYPVQEGSTEDKDIQNNSESLQSYCPVVTLPIIIRLRDHPFDQQRKNVSRQIKFGTVSGPSHPSRGGQPVRQWHKRDETKILPMKRLNAEVE